MDEDLKKIELETARVRLERERLLLQKEMGSSKPKPSKLRRYLVGTSLALLCIVGYGIYTVGENNRCDSWRHSRWSELLSEELKKDPAKYEQYMATVGQIRFGELPPKPIRTKKCAALSMIYARHSNPYNSPEPLLTHQRFWLRCAALRPRAAR